MEKYLLCINALKERTNCKSVKKELSLLEKFYNDKNLITQKGILILLNSINNCTDYNKFLEIHHELIKFCIQYESPEDDVIDEGPYTFFILYIKIQIKQSMYWFIPINFFVILEKIHTKYYNTYFAWERIM